jgi:hypothetical protein
MKPPSHLDYAFTGIVIDFAKVNPRFVKNVQITYESGKVVNHNLSGFLELLEEPGVDNAEMLVGITADLDYTLIEKILVRTLKNLHRDVVSGNGISDSCGVSQHGNRQG